MQPRREISRMLKERGLRVTQQRIAVLDFLLGSGAHPSADEIGAAINRGDAAATTSRASVYNVLNSLSRAGLVAELILDDAVARYDAKLERHHHFVCTRCGRVEDVPEPACPTLAAGRMADGRVVTAVSVTLHGLCAPCVEGPS